MILKRFQIVLYCKNSFFSSATVNNILFELFNSQSIDENDYFSFMKWTRDSSIKYFPNIKPHSGLFSNVHGSTYICFQKGHKQMDWNKWGTLCTHNIYFTHITHINIYILCKAYSYTKQETIQYSSILFRNIVVLHTDTEYRVYK